MSGSSENISRKQKMVQPLMAAAKSVATSKNWGLDNLAHDPKLIEDSRQKRPKKFEGLTETASTMFEKLEQILGSNDLRPAYWLEEGAARSRAVCKIEAWGIDYEGNSGSWSGTGFLVAPGILCTNHHVINNRDVAARSRGLFDFAALPDGSVRQVSTVRLRPDKLFWTSPVVAEDGSGGLDALSRWTVIPAQPSATCRCYGKRSALATRTS
ncbi:MULTISPECIES: hypothetical protein [unclassified Mesorhizobium]|uniref:hypothetical protein n=1 Tax=unclassified Mesorhizobium TaxID=325217 RepID=UPI003334C0A0